MLLVLVVGGCRRPWTMVYLRGALINVVSQAAQKARLYHHPRHYCCLRRRQPTACALAWILWKLAVCCPLNASQYPCWLPVLVAAAAVVEAVLCVAAAAVDSRCCAVTHASPVILATYTAKAARESRVTAAVSTG